MDTIEKQREFISSLKKGENELYDKCLTSSYENCIEQIQDLLNGLEKIKSDAQKSTNDIITEYCEKRIWFWSIRTSYVTGKFSYRAPSIHSLKSKSESQDVDIHTQQWESFTQYLRYKPKREIERFPKEINLHLTDLEIKNGDLLINLFKLNTEEIDKSYEFREKVFLNSINEINSWCFNFRNYRAQIRPCNEIKFEETIKEITITPGKCLLEGDFYKKKKEDKPWREIIGKLTSLSIYNEIFKETREKGTNTANEEQIPNDILYLERSFI